MPISPKLSHVIQFISDTDPDQFCISREEAELTKVSRRSSFCNFFSWCIYYLSFTLIPRNSKLDALSLEILHDLQEEIKEVTAEDKDLAEKALCNLSLMIENNGGSCGRMATQMLVTFAKVKALPAVKELAKKEELPLQTEAKKLLDLLEGVKQVSDHMAQLLPNLEESESFSYDEMDSLGKAFSCLDPAKLQLSPGSITCLIKNSLVHANFDCIFVIMDTMITSRSDVKQEFNAFVRGFRLYHEVCSDGQVLDSKKLSNFLLLFVYPSCKSLLNTLSKEQREQFLEDILTLPGIEEQHYLALFDHAVQHFSPNGKQSLFSRLSKPALASRLGQMPPHVLKNFSDHFEKVVNDANQQTHFV